MSQKDSRDDSKGLASTQKFNYLNLHFERGDSQRKSVAISEPSELLRSLQQNNLERN